MQPHSRPVLSLAAGALAGEAHMFDGRVRLKSFE